MWLVFPMIQVRSFLELHNTIPYLKKNCIPAYERKWFSIFSASVFDSFRSFSLVRERFKPFTCKSISFGSPDLLPHVEGRFLLSHPLRSVKPQEDPVDALLRRSVGDSLPCGVFLQPDFWVLHFQRKSEGRRDIEKPSLIHASLIISLVILLTTGDSSMSDSLVENELQLCERPCLSLSKHWQLKLEPTCIPFPSRPTNKLQLTIWICLYSCSPDQLLGKNQVPGPYSMHWIISSPHATAPAKKMSCASPRPASLWRWGDFVYHLVFKRTLIVGES